MALLSCGKPETLFCSSVQGDLVLEYGYYRGTDGALQATCSISDRASTYTNVVTYAPGQGGQRDGGCSLVFDLDEPTRGFWTFTREPLAAEYTDHGSPLNGRVVRFERSLECL